MLHLGPGEEGEVVSDSIEIGLGICIVWKKGMLAGNASPVHSEVPTCTGEYGICKQRDGYIVSELILDHMCDGCSSTSSTR